MKKIIWLAILAVVGVYGTGAVMLSEMGANRFLDELESLSLRGQSEEYCALLHDDLEVSLQDETGDPPATIEGGKQELCDYVTTAGRTMSLLGVSTQLTRDDFTVERSWLHPWTANVSYAEDRTTTMTRVGVTLKSRSEDKLTLVQTLRGVRLRKLESHAWLAE